MFRALLDRTQSLTRSCPSAPLYCACAATCGRPSKAGNCEARTGRPSDAAEWVLRSYLGRIWRDLRQLKVASKIAQQRVPTTTLERCTCTRPELADELRLHCRRKSRVHGLTNKSQMCEANSGEAKGQASDASLRRIARRRMICCVLKVAHDVKRLQRCNVAWATEWQRHRIDGAMMQQARSCESDRTRSRMADDDGHCKRRGVRQ